MSNLNSNNRAYYNSFEKTLSMSLKKLLLNSGDELNFNILISIGISN